jgi:hypothetical protein
MYDLERDPDERDNLVDRSNGEALEETDSALGAELREQLDGVMAANGTAPPDQR